MSCRFAATVATYKYWFLLGVGARKPLSGRGVAPSGGRRRARN